ncbi:uncharacterized protein LOC103169452 [Ornithorhynchus anatinus]|uniref:uncharacterized protein LOC103169452 n=1 Tax=Ornithorhynchus anatinus TaxID=9258 RepID=UPI0010A943A1|nr:uncharacterized protein LOC103169452 [Ornithorhynchus anatinus]
MMKKWRSKKSQKRQDEAASVEEASIQPEEAEEHQEKTNYMDLLKSIFWPKSVWNKKTKKRQREEEHRQELITEQTLYKAIEQGKFLDAIKDFDRCDQVEAEIKAALLKFIKQKTGEAVGMAFQTGDQEGLEKPESGAGLVLQGAEGHQEKPGRDEESEDSMSDSSDSCDSELEGLFGAYAGLEIPPFKQDPDQKMDAYLEELNNKIWRNLKEQREENLSALYQRCFQDVLLCHLNKIVCSNLSIKDLYQMHIWASCNIYGKGKKHDQAKAQEEGSLDAIKFCYLVIQIEERILKLLQEELDKTLQNAIHSSRKAQVGQLPSSFCECYQVVNETIKTTKVLGYSIYSKAQVQSLETFSRFLKRFCQEVEGLLQDQANKEHCQEFEILKNCHILRKAWLNLKKKYHPSPELHSTIVEDLKVVERKTSQQLQRGFTAELQKTLKDHFQARNGDLKNVLKLIRDFCKPIQETSTPKSLSKTLLKDFFEWAAKEYLQALFSHLLSKERYVCTTPLKIPPNVMADWQSLKDLFPQDLGSFESLETAPENPKYDREDPVLETLEVLFINDKESKELETCALLEKYPFLRSKLLTIILKRRFCWDESSSLLTCTIDDGMKIQKGSRFCCCCPKLWRSNDPVKALSMAQLA